MSGQHVRSWLRPPRKPAPTYFASTSDRVLENLGALDDARADQVLAEAELAYKESADRAESGERRATTIQGAIAIAASLSLAGGSLLLDDAKLPDRGWRWALGVAFGLAVITLGISAWRAYLVTWPRYLWASPTFEEVFEHAAEPDAALIKRRRAADFCVCYGRNQAIAALKTQLLASSVRWLIGALALIALFACLLAASAIHNAPGHGRPTTTGAAHDTKGK